MFYCLDSMPFPGFSNAPHSAGVVVKWFDNPRRSELQALSSSRQRAEGRNGPAGRSDRMAFQTRRADCLASCGETTSGSMNRAEEQFTWPMLPASEQTLAASATCCQRLGRMLQSAERLVVAGGPTRHGGVIVEGPATQNAACRPSAEPARRNAGDREPEVQ